MTFFQNSVLNKHLKTQDSEAVKTAYAKFTARFHNPEVQENIRNSKEEQYQGEFLIDLFVNVLGYTKNPAPAFNLTTEYKNVKDSKKADGAIILNWVNGPRVVAVIELKGTDTTDLNRVESQAFGYKNNQPDCVYVITSNFEKLRFYIDNAIEHIEFNLFTLTFKEFELLWICLAFVNIEKNLPKRIKDESVSQEDAITKNLYNDYSRFKRELHQNLVALNPQYDALTLFRKSQKLLDRFLFLFFAEDRQLLPPNSVRLILADWRDLQDRDVQIPLYDRFRKYFEYLNTGYKGKRYDVYAYNGGLFRHDELLDALQMDDELLYRHAMKLSEYDFISEVDVNILGHIFENSLNELDEIKAQLAGQAVDKTKSKRKKDGVFYTPKYITKYIVDNTVGKLCTEKKTALGLAEEDYITDRKRTKKTIQPLFEVLNAYRDWLLQLTICDPACGSGAFLNQALDFLISEHRLIDELQAKLFGSSMVMGDFENSILENNLFGVDINEESVEIAKLSLWLRTAQPNRKLNDLNNNLKCGNSLIDDPAVAGDKAFNWQTEFPDVFKLKDKLAWHVTFVTHDTRTSARMIKYRVRERRADGEMHIDRSVYLDDKAGLKVSAIIAQIVVEDKINCMAFNIGVDHVHMLLVCEEEELPQIVRKLKGKSAQKYKEYLGIPKEETYNLWAQKFHRVPIISEEQFQNTLNYIVNNRDKHFKTNENRGITTPDFDDPLTLNMELHNKGLQPLVDADSMDEERLTFSKGLQPLVSTTDPDDPLTLNLELHNKGVQPLVDADSMDEERLTFSKGLQPLVSTTDPDDPLTLNLELHNKGCNPLMLIAGRRTPDIQQGAAAPCFNHGSG
ncbi:MAG: transposase [Bacteroidales bacterium]|nr:transposase [Bacteroidales bacterium]